MNQILIYSFGRHRGYYRYESAVVENDSLVVTFLRSKCLFSSRSGCRCGSQMLTTSWRSIEWKNETFMNPTVGKLASLLASLSTAKGWRNPSRWTALSSSLCEYVHDSDALVLCFALACTKTNNKQQRRGRLARATFLLTSSTLRYRRSICVWL